MEKHQGWYGNSEGHVRAGRKGGKRTAQTHGKDFYKKNGRKGGKVSPGNFKYNHELAVRAGRIGGKAKHKNR